MCYICDKREEEWRKGRDIRLARDGIDKPGMFIRFAKEYARQKYDMELKELLELGENE